MNAGIVTVEPVPAERRTGVLGGVAYVVTQRLDDGSMAVHLPATAAEKAMPLLDYGRHVAAQEGARWVQPPPWVPGVVDDYADITEDGNGLVRNRRAVRSPKPTRAAVAS